MLVVDHHVREFVLDDLGHLALAQPAADQHGAFLGHPEAVGAVQVGETDRHAAVGRLPQQGLIDH